MDSIGSNIDLTPITFHLYSLRFEPYTGQQTKHNSRSIVKEIMTYLSREIQQGKGYLVNRHEKRDKAPQRELFLTQAVFMHKENRVRCSIALLRSGRIPMLKPADKFMLIPLDKNQGEIAEQTHFYIDYSKGRCVLCVEFNYHGPRVSDIEYYLRNVARDKLRVSKVTEVTMFMDTSLDKTLAELRNVLNIDIKVQPKKLSGLDTDVVGQYFTSLSSFGQKIQPKFLKLEAMFQTQGRSIQSSTEINEEANKMIRNLLTRFKSKPYNIDCFENFVVKYEDKEGEEEVFNLLKGKKEIIVEIDLKTNRSERQWYELIEPELNNFVDSLT